MRKILLVLLAIIFLSTPAYAGKRATSKTLTISNVPISATVVGAGVTVTSDSLLQTGNVGFSSLILDVSGNIAVSYQVSRNGSTWYTPYTTDGSSLTAAGTIASSVTANRWIVLPTKLAPYVRFVFASTGSSTISSTYVWQDEN